MRAPEALMSLRQKTTRPGEPRSIMMKLMNLSLLRPGAGAALAAALVGACSSSKSDSTPSTATTTAAAVAGPADTHCAGKPVVVASQAACHVVADAGGADADAGAGEATPDYGETLYGSEGDDDDCKYHVSWQSTAVAVGNDVTLSIVATNRNDSSVLAGAKPFAEVFLDDTHPAPNSGAKTTETSPGNYLIGPVRFDVAGKWTVRFHFHDECGDGEESPHGHVAFFANVPSPAKAP
jgi:hypothetical protein